MYAIGMQLVVVPAFAKLLADEDVWHMYYPKMTGSMRDDCVCMRNIKT